MNVHQELSVRLIEALAASLDRAEPCANPARMQLVAVIERVAGDMLDSAAPGNRAAISTAYRSVIARLIIGSHGAKWHSYI